MKTTSMNVCFFCQTPVPGDCAVRVEMSSRNDARDVLDGKISQEEYWAMSNEEMRRYRKERL